MTIKPRHCEPCQAIHNPSRAPRWIASLALAMTNFDHRSVIASAAKQSNFCALVIPASRHCECPQGTRQSIFRALVIASAAKQSTLPAIHGLLRRAFAFLAVTFLVVGIASTTARAACSNPSGAAGSIIYNEDSNVPQYCDDTNWVAMAPPGGFDVNAVTFDGTNDYLNKATPLAGPSATTQWSGSFWLRRTGGIGNYQMIFDGPSTPFDDNSIDLQLDNRILFAARDVSATIVLNVSSNAISDTNWHHVMFSFDLTDVAKRHIYIDDVSAINAVTTYNTSGTMDFDMTGVNIGISNSGVNRLRADLAEFWIDFGTYIDLSVESNRRKFITASGRPAFLGRSGQAPTGSPPDIYLSGDATNFHVNKGTGGGFTVTGALTNAATSPDDLNAGVGGLVTLGTVTDATILDKVEDIQVRGNYAYTASEETGNIAVIDISDPNAPVITDSLDIAPGPTSGSQGIALNGNYLYATECAGASGGFVVLDISNPAAISTVYSSSADPELGSCRGLYYNPADGHVYSMHIGSINKIVVFDVSNPASPQKRDVFTPTLASEPHEIAFLPDGKAVVTGINSNNIVSLDISDPANITEIAAFAHASFNGPREIIVDGSFAYVASPASDSITIVNVSDPANMTFVGVVTNVNLDLVEGIAKFGNYVYATSGGVSNDRFTIVDVSNPASPAVIANIQDNVKLDGADNVAIQGRYAYVGTADPGDRLTIVDLGSFTNCINPDGVAGQLNYNADSRTPMYCDGDHWVAMTPADTTESGLVGHWLLDETAGATVYDAVAGRNGVWYDSADDLIGAEAGAGRIDGSLNFDGTNDVVVIPHDDIFNITGPITLSAWVNPDTLSTGATENRIVLKGDGSYINSLFALDIRDEKPLIVFGQNVTDTINGCNEPIEECAVGLSATVPTGTWSHIVGVYDGTAAYVYMNGVLAGSNVFTHALSDATYPLAIGNRSQGSTTDEFDGRIDDVRIYNRALSLAEVVRLYEKTANARSLLTDPALVAYWPFNDGDGATTAADMAGDNIGYSSGDVVFSSSSGKIGGAAEFLGSHGYVKIPHSEAINFERTDPFTLMAWIWRDTSTTEDDIIEKVTSGFQGYALFLPGSSDRVQLNITRGLFVDQIAVEATTSVSTGAWHHVAATYDGSSVAAGTRIYIDGVAQPLAVLVNNLSSSILTTEPLFIGSYEEDDNCCVFDGKIDDFRIYSRALTPAEVSEIYTAGNAGLAAQDCTAPNGAEGAMIYNTGLNLIQYCDGANWVRIGKN